MLENLKKLVLFLKTLKPDQFDIRHFENPDGGRCALGWAAEVFPDVFKLKPLDYYLSKSLYYKGNNKIMFRAPWEGGVPRPNPDLSEFFGTSDSESEELFGLNDPDRTLEEEIRLLEEYISKKEENV